MSIEDRVRELNGGTYTKKSYSVEEVQSILVLCQEKVQIKCNQFSLF